MIRAEYDYHLPVPPAEAFAYLADPTHDKDWQSSCTDSALQDAVPGLGCRYAITFSFLGRQMNFLAEMHEFEPVRRFGFRVLEGPFSYDGHYVLEPEGRGTRVHWQFNAEPAGFFGIIPPVLLRKVLVAQVEKDVATLTTILVRRPEPALAG